MCCNVKFVIYKKDIFSLKFAVHERITTAFSCYVTHKHMLALFIKKKSNNSQTFVFRLIVNSFAKVVRKLLLYFYC